MQSTDDKKESSYTIISEGKPLCTAVNDLNGRVCYCERISLKRFKHKHKEKINMYLNKISLLNHVNLVKYSPHRNSISNLFSDVYTDMNYGCTLQDMIDEHIFYQVPFSEEQIWDILVQCLAGLSYIHNWKDLDGNSSLPHGCLDPQFIYFDSFGVLKIGNFAKSCINAASAIAAQQPQMYDAPEVKTTGARSHISDTYSLAKLIHSLATIDHHFCSDPTVSVAELRKLYPFPEISLQYSNELYNIIKLMATAEEERRPSATALLKNPLIADHVSDLNARRGIVLGVNNRTELMNAVLRGDVDAVLSLLPYQVGLVERSGKTALIHAAESGHVEIAKHLVRYECRYQIVANGEWRGMTALMFAARTGNHGIVTILKPYECNISTESGHFALRLATVSGRTECANELFIDEFRLLRHFGWTTLMIGTVFTFTELNKNFLSTDLGQQDNRGFTALMVAAANNKNDMLDYLIEREAGMSNCNDYTALMAAARANNVQAVNMLIPREAGMKDDNGWSALMYAAHGNNIECILALLDKEAGLQSNGLQTAMMIAAQCNHLEAVKMLAPYEQKKQDIDGFTAFLYASDRGNCQIVDFLLDFEGEMVSNSGYTGLMLAAKKGHAKIVKLLAKSLSKRVTNMFNRAPGTTALMFACFNRQYECAKILCRYERGMKTTVGTTALMAAVSSKAPDCVQLLAPHELFMKNIDNKTVFDMDTTEEIREILLLQKVKRSVAKQTLLGDSEEKQPEDVN